MKKPKKRSAKKVTKVRMVPYKQYAAEIALIYATFVKKSTFLDEIQVMRNAISRLETTSIRSTDLKADALKLNEAISCREDMDLLEDKVHDLRAIVAKLIPPEGLDRRPPPWTKPISARFPQQWLEGG